MEYFTYDGSLTTPGCTQSVKWTVLADIIPIQATQVKNPNKFQ
jgi:carbonic anhydrase